MMVVILYGFTGLVTLNLLDMVDYGMVLGTSFIGDGGWRWRRSAIRRRCRLKFSVEYR